MSRPLRPKAETSAMILDAAGLLFANVGYFDVTVARIARRAGLSPATVRAHFGDKAELWRLTMGCPAPDPRLAEEMALAAALSPDRPVWLYVERDRARASIGNPARALAVHGAGSFSGQGRTAAEALRGARAEADRLGDGSRIGVAA